MSFPLSPLSDGVKTATLKISATNIPANSRWIGEIDVTTINCNESAELLDLALILNCFVEATNNVVFRFVNQTRHDPALGDGFESRYHLVKRVFIEVENVSGSTVTFTDKLVTLWGINRAPRPSASISTALTSLTTSSSPFVVKDVDGATVVSNFIEV